MGFPVGCSELVLPRFLVWIIFLLGVLRKAITWCLASVGLADLLDADAIILGGGGGTSSASPFHPTSYPYENHYHPHGPLPATLLLRNIPAVPYARPEGDDVGDRDLDSESCAVCLYEFEGGEEVRRLGICRHVFHRCCIDAWVQIGSRTCPLCRTPIADEHDGGTADAAANPYGVYHDLIDAYYGGDGDGDYSGLFPPLLADDLSDHQSLEFISWPIAPAHTLPVS